MTNGSIVTTKGKNVMLYRMYTENASLSATQYLAPSKVQLGVNNSSALITDTELDYPIPLADGVVNDNGDNQLAGSNGGDNTTDNTTTYKEGAGSSDNTAQNLITTGSNTTKTWTISNLATLGTIITDSKYAGLSLYIKDSIVLGNIVSIEIKLGSDSSNYYSLTFLNAVLDTGWNWLTNSGIVSSWTETGTVSGDIDTFIIEIITDDADDAFITRDVIYDLLRSWDYADTLSSFQASFPTFDYTNNEVTIRTYINSLQANGFLISGVGVVNEDSTPLLLGEDTISDESKSLTDEFTFVIKDRVL